MKILFLGLLLSLMSTPTYSRELNEKELLEATRCESNRFNGSTVPFSLKRKLAFATQEEHDFSPNFFFCAWAPEYSLNGHLNNDDDNNSPPTFSRLPSMPTLIKMKENAERSFKAGQRSSLYLVGKYVQYLSSKNPTNLEIFSLFKDIVITSKDWSVWGNQMTTKLFNNHDAIAEAFIVKNMDLITILFEDLNKYPTGERYKSRALLDELAKLSSIDKARYFNIISKMYPKSQSSFISKEIVQINFGAENGVAERIAYLLLHPNLDQVKTIYFSDGDGHDSSQSFNREYLINYATSYFRY